MLLASLNGACALPTPPELLLAYLERLQLGLQDRVLIIGPRGQSLAMDIVNFYGCTVNVLGSPVQLRNDPNRVCYVNVNTALTANYDCIISNCGASQWAGLADFFRVCRAASRTGGRVVQLEWTLGPIPFSAPSLETRPTEFKYCYFWHAELATELAAQNNLALRNSYDLSDTTRTRLADCVQQPKRFVKNELLSDVTEPRHIHWLVNRLAGRNLKITLNDYKAIEVLNEAQCAFL